MADNYILQYNYEYDILKEKNRGTDHPIRSNISSKRKKEKRNRRTKIPPVHRSKNLKLNINNA